MEQQHKTKSCLSSSPPGRQDTCCRLHWEARSPSHSHSWRGLPETLSWLSWTPSPWCRKRLMKRRTRLWLKIMMKRMKLPVLQMSRPSAFLRPRGRRHRSSGNAWWRCGSRAGLLDRTPADSVSGNGGLSVPPRPWETAEWGSIRQAQPSNRYQKRQEENLKQPRNKLV